MPLEPLAFLKIQYVLYFYIVFYDNNYSIPKVDQPEI